MKPTIEIDGLTRRFGTTVAVHPFRLTIGPGGITGLLGPNGSGKTTLLRMTLGLVPPDAGSCTVDGVPLAGDGTAIRKRATYSPGEIAVYGELRAERHLDWLLRGRGPDALGRALAIARSFELPLRQRVRGFSHGMKRQLHLAAALAPDVRVRILDEPTEGLDPSRRGQVLDLLAADAARGTTILLSSHHLGEVDRICERMLFLEHGKLLDEEAARKIHARARRALQIRWGRPVDREKLTALLAPHGELRLADDTHATLFLTGEDPRAAIGAVAGSPDLPEPTALVFGELSLPELYRELYGTEGV
jgi:ABC-type multidrug transport system ATPase subunit